MSSLLSAEEARPVFLPTQPAAPTKHTLLSSSLQLPAGGWNSTQKCCPFIGRQPGGLQAPADGRGSLAPRPTFQVPPAGGHWLWISLSTFEALTNYFLIMHPCKVHVVFTVLQMRNLRPEAAD